MTNDTLHFKGNSVLILAALIIIAAGLKSSQELMVPFLLSVFIATIAATP
ncbi:MAG: putative PurR-regulated permease PerM, partial [Candidatus Azotimanducaceae bacterium]